MRMRPCVVLALSACVDGHGPSVKNAGHPPTIAVDLGGGVKWDGVLIPAGTFVMGAPAGEARTEQESALERQHTVTISRPFYMGKYELTQAQFERVTRQNPSATRGGDLPVHNVSSQVAQEVCLTAIS